MEFGGGFKSIKLEPDLRFIDFETVYKPLLRQMLCLLDKSILYKDNDSIFTKGEII